jgi:hypothetical protein
MSWFNTAPAIDTGSARYNEPTSLTTGVRSRGGAR